MRYIWVCRVWSNFNSNIWLAYVNYSSSDSDFDLIYISNNHVKIKIIFKKKQLYSTSVYLFLIKKIVLIDDKNPVFNNFKDNISPKMCIIN